MWNSAIISSFCFLFSFLLYCFLLSFVPLFPNVFPFVFSFPSCLVLFCSLFVFWPSIFFLGFTPGHGQSRTGLGASNARTKKKEEHGHLSPLLLPFLWDCDSAVSHIWSSSEGQAGAGLLRPSSSRHIGSLASIITRTTAYLGKKSCPSADRTAGKE